MKERNFFHNAAVGMKRGKQASREADARKCGFLEVPLTKLKHPGLTLPRIPLHRTVTMKTFPDIPNQSNHPTQPLNLPAEAGCPANTPPTAAQPYGSARSVTAEKVLRYVEPVHPETEIEKIFVHFSENKGVRAIPVVKHGRPVGLISRNEFVYDFVQTFHRELIGKKPCSGMMNANPLLVEKSTPIHELSGFLCESEIQHFTDGFIITEQGSYLGLGTGQDLLREITKTQIENARHANPLTLLPGNVPVNEHIDCLLHSQKSFTVCHADLDHFKPFNDVFGYRKGDEAIQFTARLLGWACDQNLDFIGHIGGDDFMLVMQSANWENRCKQALTSFAQTSAVLFDEEHRPNGGYYSEDRQGRLVHHPLPTLSIGAVCITPGMFRSHHEVSEAVSAASKMAKRKSGNGLFVERRELRKFEQHEMPHVYY
jgi:diguanylate cyclase (GGDEF)-like protein